MKVSNSFASYIILILVASCATAAAQNSATSNPVARLPDVVVTGAIIGSPEAAREIPGSASYLGAEEIREQNQTDINRVLRQVPGVYVREEDGYGNFPNISLRGVTTVRNSKITVMEDGILAAPAPYTDPAAYYSPALGRMSGLEIIKGSSQIKYGPHITGGVLNYLSTPIPGERSGLFKTHYGSDNEVFALANFGEMVDVRGGRLGYLVEGFYHRSDGFRKIDAAPGVKRDQTGFVRIEPMVKLAFEPDTAVPQRIEVKYGYTDFDADETYLGLTEGDFAASPYRRYAATRFDNIATEQHRTYVRHAIKPTEQFQITTTGYYNQFDRAWYKLNDARIAGDPTWRNLSETLAGAHGANNALEVLRGTQAGDLRYRNNNRSYYGWGIEQNYRYEFDTGSVDHTLDAGVRYHYDESSRFQNDTVYTQDATEHLSVPQLAPPVRRTIVRRIPPRGRFTFRIGWILAGFRLPPVCATK
jgi:Fe(3+) dicitrate transport protein